MAAQVDDSQNTAPEPENNHHFSHFNFSFNWLDPFSPQVTKPSTSPESKRPVDGKKRLYFGAPSLVPQTFVPSHPVVWDGTLASGRKINVRNFYRHFASYQVNELNEQAVKALESLGEYKKPIWYSPMIASAAPIMFEHEVEFKREELSDSDGGTLTIDWAFPKDSTGKLLSEPSANIPTVVIFPGLAGHSGRDYIRSISARVTSFLQARACVLNWRGFNCKLTSNKVFRPDDISDMERVIAHAKESFPGSKVFAIGFSAGSNQLVKYLGMHHGEHPVEAAASVCNGFEYEPHIRRIEGSPVGEAIYSRGMTFLHQEYLRVHGEKLAEQVEGFDLQKALSVSKHSDLDEVLVLSLYGYQDMKEYYAAVSSRPYIPCVDVPLLCLQAADDPLFTEGDVKCYQVLPVEDVYDNPNLIYFETEYGAHLSFVESTSANGMIRCDYTFSDRAIEAYFRSVAPTAWPKP